MWPVPVQSATGAPPCSLLDASLAQSIRRRAMQIPRTSVNVMDERG